MNDEEPPAICIGLRNKRVLNFQFYPKVDEQGNEHLQFLEMFVPMAIFEDNAQTFGQLKDTDLGDLYRCGMQLFIYMYNTIASAQAGPVYFFIENVISDKAYENDNEDSDDSEDVEDFTVGFRFRLIIQAACSAAGIIQYLIAENEKNLDDRPPKSRKPPKPRTRLDRMTRTDYRALCTLFFVADAIYEDTIDLDKIEEPMYCYNPVNVFTLRRSIEQAKIFNATEDFCTDSFYQLTDPETQQFYYHISPYVQKYNYPIYGFAMNNLYFSRYLFPWIQTHETEESLNEKSLYIRIRGSIDSQPDSDEQIIGTKRKLNEEYDAGIQKTKQVVALSTLESLKKDMEKQWTDAYDDTDTARTVKRARSDNSFTLNNRDDAFKAYQELGKKYRKVQSKGIEAFRKIFHEKAKTPDAIKSIAKFWSELYKKSDGYIFKPRRRYTKNLGIFGDWLVQVALGLEHYLNVNVAHGDIITSLLGAWQIYFGTKFAFHTMFTGPPEAGKTFTFDKIHDICIPGTAVSIAMSTAKAKTATSDSFGYKIEIFQEIPPSTLGIEGKSKHPSQQSSSTNNTDAEALFKNILSEGKLIVQSITCEKGKRKSEIHNIDAHCCVLIATNASSHEIPTAITSRFYHRQWVNQDRTDNGGMAHAMTRQSIDKALNPFVDDLRQMQAMIAIIGLMVSCKILKDVDMTVAIIIYSQLQEHNHLFHLQGLKPPRNFQRYKFLVQTIATARAIETVFRFNPTIKESNSTEQNLTVSSTSDGNEENRNQCEDNENNENNSENDETHHYTETEYVCQKNRFSLQYVKECEKHMYSKVEDCVLALSLLSDQYEDPIMFDILDTIKHMIFGDIDLNSKEFKDKYENIPSDDAVSFHPSNMNEEKPSYNTNQQLTMPGIPAEILHTVHDPAVSVSNGQASMMVCYFNNVQYSDIPENRQFAMLARIIYGKMRRKPQHSRLMVAIKSLSSEMVILPDKKHDSALKYQNGRLTVALQLLKSNQHNKLKRALQHILTYKHASKGDYLYGRFNSQKPYIFETLKIDPSKSKRQLQVVTSNHMQKPMQEFMAQYSSYLKNSTEFTPNGYSIIDVPLDEYGFEKHMQNIHPIKDSSTQEGYFPFKPDAIEDLLNKNPGKFQYPDDLLKCKTQKQLIDERTEKATISDNRSLFNQILLNAFNSNAVNNNSDSTATTEIDTPSSDSDEASDSENEEDEDSDDDDDDAMSCHLDSMTIDEWDREFTNVTTERTWSWVPPDDDIPFEGLHLN